MYSDFKQTNKRHVSVIIKDRFTAFILCEGDGWWWRMVKLRYSPRQKHKQIQGEHWAEKKKIKKMATCNYKALDCITSYDIEALGIPSKLAEQLHEKLAEIVNTHGAATPATWQNITTHILSPDLPFSFHQLLYYGCYKDFGPDPPAWIPDP